ncbi:MAG TPA: cation diffusion facilitator family transporter [Candidatus Aminicenantes bacterium]|nr:cation diffusion facilitator family transporter [Candidatus Aminicenantes bacterium]
MNPNETRGLMLAVKASLFSNIALALIKAASFFIVNSLAVAADLGISFVSLGVSLFLYYAIRMSAKPADTFHNYGYGKIENVTEAVEGVILIGLSLSMSFMAVMHLVRPGGEVRYPAIGLTASLLGMAINFWGSGFILRLGRKYASPALRAEGLHFRLEGFISASVALSFVLVILLRKAGLAAAARYVDPSATLIVSLLIAVPSVRLLREAFMKLLDASIEEAGQMDIMKALARHFGVYCDFANIRTRTAGRRQFVDLTLILPADLSVKKAHAHAADLKNDLAVSIPESEIVVHMEPCAGDCAYAAEGRACPYLAPTGKNGA